jgi:hypothetical protein
MFGLVQVATPARSAWSSSSFALLAALLIACATAAPVPRSPAADTGILYMQIFDNECGVASRRRYVVWEAQRDATRDPFDSRPTPRTLRWRGLTDETGTLRIEGVPSGDYWVELEGIREGSNMAVLEPTEQVAQIRMLGDCRPPDP